MAAANGGAGAPMSGAMVAPKAFAKAAPGLGVTKVDDLEYDLGLMLAVDPHPLDPARTADPGKLEAYLDEVFRDNAQLLVKRMFELPFEKTDEGPIVRLPRRTTRLPRTKPVPEAKPLTRWEKFAREKGIKKEKRARMVWDEAANEWRPRFGFKRVGSEGEKGPWLMETKSSEDALVDPYEKASLLKKDRVLKNQIAQVRNKQAALRVMGKVPAGIPTTLALSEGDVGGPLDQGKRKRPRPGGETKETKVARLQLAQGATASMGRFDRHLEGEPERPKEARRVKRAPVEISAVEESRRQLDTFKRMMKGGSIGDSEGTGTGGGGAAASTAPAFGKKAWKKGGKGSASAAVLSGKAGQKKKKRVGK